MYGYRSYKVDEIEACNLVDFYNNTMCIYNK